MKIAVYSLLLIAALSFRPGTAVGVPSWARSNATQIDGKNLVTVCSGTGPSVDLARGEAVRGCKASASDMLQHSGTVRSALFETNKDVLFHQSVEENLQFDGLLCQPLKEDVEEIEPGKIRVWLQCQFDMTRASVNQAPDPLPVETTGAKVDDTAKIHMSSLKGATVILPEDVTSLERVVINIASVPQCHSLTVRGARPRVVKCSTQPAPIVISPNDESVVINANGYLPKTLDLKLKKWKNHESIQVILDKR